MLKQVKLIDGDITNLADCPIGLFYLESEEEKIICMKTEYFTNHGGVEAFIVESGERLSCNGMTETNEGCKKIKVNPISFEDCD